MRFGLGAEKWVELRIEMRSDLGVGRLAGVRIVVGKLC